MNKFLAIFFAASSVVALAMIALGMARQKRLERIRLRKLVSEEGGEREEREALSTIILKKFTKQGAGSRQQEGPKDTMLQMRLVQAGLYKVEHPHDEHVRAFQLVQMIMMFVAPVVFVTGWLFRLWEMSLQWAVVAALGAVVMMNLPSVWLNRRKESRQAMLRNTLPDALDVIMICLEGGLTLSGAIIRVATELRSVHPDLATEMNIVQRQIQMGNSPGEALRQFSKRVDLDEARSLASAVLQSERFGASLVQAVRIQADLLRLRRLQQAEERAHKASVKVLFPTLLLIFPAVFIVLVGPAGIQIVEIFSKMNESAATATDFPAPP